MITVILTLILTICIAIPTPNLPLNLTLTLTLILTLILTQYLILILPDLQTLFELGSENGINYTGLKNLHIAEKSPKMQPVV